MIKKNPEFIYHVRKEPWGVSIFVMEKSGKALGRVYHHDDNDSRDTAYIDNVSVESSDRKQGLGTRLIEFLEEIGKSIGAINAFLYVTEDSWMHDWYLRMGYHYHSLYDGDKDLVWLSKRI